MQGRIHLRKFYIRRAFRILPPAITYLAVIGALGLASAIPVAHKEWLSALFFCRNITQLSETLGYRGWYTGHFWSLAVEEHFYLILPAFLVFTPKRWRLTIMTAMALLFAAWRFYFLPLKPWLATLDRTDMRLDELWVPAIFAILLTLAGPRRILEAIARFWVVPAAVLIYLMIASPFRGVAGLVGYAGMPLILLGTVLRPSSYLGRFLELSPLRWVGRVSYSIYLWQELFFTGHFLQSFGLTSLFAYWPIRYICLVACASASYYFVEKPLMKIGHRLAPPPTPGRIDTETQVAGIEAHGYPTIKIPALDPR